MVETVAVEDAVIANDGDAENPLPTGRSDTEDKFSTTAFQVVDESLTIDLMFALGLITEGYKMSVSLSTLYDLQYLN
jgi:hypothetical protein